MAPWPRLGQVRDLRRTRKLVDTLLQTSRSNNNNSIKMTSLTRAATVCWLLAVAIVPMKVSGFTGQARRSAFVANHPSRAPNRGAPTTLFAEVLTESGFENKQPSSVEARSLGVLDWPKQVKMGAWTERFDQGQVAARYILEGGGMVVVTLFENDGFTPKVGIPEEYRVVPGCLVEAMGPCKLEWRTDEDAEMVVLTPGYEQGSMLAAVGAIFIVLCGALIAGVGQ